MTRREYLAEQYEDALFALLMEPVAISQGIKAEEENERLKNDPNAIVPLSLQNRCIKTIKMHYSKQEMRKNSKVASKLLVHIALVALMAVMLVATAFALSPTFRAKAMNWLVETFEDHTEVSIVPQKDSNEYDLDIQSLLPEGFTLVERGAGTAYGYTLYENPEENARISFKTIDSIGGTFAFDTEDAIVENMVLFGSNVMTIEKNSTIQVLLRENDDKILEVKAENLQKDVLLSIIEKMLQK